MRRILTLVALTKITFFCGVGPLVAQDPPKLPEAALYANLPELLRSAELHFTDDGKKLLVLRHFNGKNEPLVTVHDVTTGRELYHPLVGSDLYGKAELASDLFGRFSGTFRHEGITVSLSPNGKLFLTCSFQTVRVWDIATETKRGGTGGRESEHLIVPRNRENVTLRIPGREGGAGSGVCWRETGRVHRNPIPCSRNNNR